MSLLQAKSTIQGANAGLRRLDVQSLTQRYQTEMRIPFGNVMDRPEESNLHLFPPEEEVS
jgi:hypothetical protein